MTIHVQVYKHVYGTEASKATLPELYGDILPTHVVSLRIKCFHIPSVMKSECLQFQNYC